MAAGVCRTITFSSTVQPVLAEGWFGDPYFRHDQRWFTEGVPTALVRDEGVESSDPPPDTRSWESSELDDALGSTSPVPGGRHLPSAPRPGDPILRPGIDDALVLRPVMETVREATIPGWRYPIVCYGAAALVLAWLGPFGVLFAVPIVLLGSLPLLWLPSLIRSLAADRRMRGRRRVPGTGHRDDPTVRLITVRDVAASCLVAAELCVLVYIALHIA